MPMRTTDEEVIYSRDVGGHNIMKIFTERVYYQKNRKDVEETHEAQKISCLLLKAQKRPWNGIGGQWNGIGGQWNGIGGQWNGIGDNGTSLVDY